MVPFNGKFNSAYNPTNWKANPSPKTNSDGKNSNMMLALPMYVAIRSPSRHTMGMNSLRVFLVSLSPTHSQNMESNGVQQLDRFPR